MSIAGFGGHNTKINHRVTVKWNVIDDKGTAQSFVIPNTYYSPEGKYRILSLQHWEKTQKINEGQHKNPHAITNDQHVTLMWNMNNNQLTVPLNKTSNVGILQGVTNDNPKHDLSKILVNKGQERFIACPTVQLDEDEEDSFLHQDKITSTDWKPNFGNTVQQV